MYRQRIERGRTCTLVERFVIWRATLFLQSGCGESVLILTGLRSVAENRQLR